MRRSGETSENLAALFVGYVRAEWRYWEEGLCAQAPVHEREFPYTGIARRYGSSLNSTFFCRFFWAPIFVVISEWLGYRKLGSSRYDRLAKEVPTKVTVILYSMTAC